MESECKGCKTCGIYGCLNRFDRMLEKEQCPCINCLIKMICLDECEEFLKFGKMANEKYDGERYDAERM